MSNKNVARDARRVEARKQREAQRAADSSRSRAFLEKIGLKTADEQQADEQDEDDSPEPVEAGAVGVPSAPAPTAPLTNSEVIERHFVSEQRLNEMEARLIIDRVRGAVVEPPTRAPVIEPLPERGVGPGQPEAEHDPLHASFVKQGGRENLSASQMSHLEAHTERQWAKQREWSRKRMEYAGDLRYIEEEEERLRIESRDEPVEGCYSALTNYTPEARGWGVYRPRGSGQKRRQARQQQLDRLREVTLEQIRALGPKPKFIYVPDGGLTHAPDVIVDPHSTEDGAILAVVQA